MFERALARIDRAFAEVIDAAFDPGGDEDWERLGLAYTDLLADRDLLMMMPGFAAGGSRSGSATSSPRGC